MSNIISVSIDQKQQLDQLHEKLESNAQPAGCSAAAASFLLIGALIVITCGCLCLALPGVNVMNDVILRAVIPGMFAITASIPLIVIAIKYNLEKNRYHRDLIDTMISQLEEHKIPEKKRKARIHFILHNFLNWKQDPDEPTKLLKNKSWTAEYQNKILTEIKERIGKEKKERNPRQEKIAIAIDKAMERIGEKE